MFILAERSSWILSTTIGYYTSSFPNVLRYCVARVAVHRICPGTIVPDLVQGTTVPRSLDILVRKGLLG
jgi:hypothetical protein